MIRTGTILDLEELAAIEYECFPSAEAASRESIKARLLTYPECFWIYEENQEILSFVNGMATDEPILRDEMYECAQLHNPQGKWQMIFGVNTRPSYRRKGYAGLVLEQMLEDSRSRGRRGCVLTCKEELIPYYAGFGFVNQGISKSQHGGALWYDMVLIF